MPDEPISGETNQDNPTKGVFHEPTIAFYENQAAEYRLYLEKITNHAKVVFIAFFTCLTILVSVIGVKSCSELDQMKKSAEGEASKKIGDAIEASRNEFKKELSSRVELETKKATENAVGEVVRSITAFASLQVATANTELEAAKQLNEDAIKLYSNTKDKLEKYQRIFETVSKLDLVLTKHNAAIEQYVKYYLDKQADSGIPVGAILAFAGPKEDIPPGFRLCDGSLLSAEEYPQLFNAIRFSHGRNQDEYRIPDLRGQFLRGTDPDRKADSECEKRARASDGGNVGCRVGSIQQATVRDHRHLASFEKVTLRIAQPSNTESIKEYDFAVIVKKKNYDYISWMHSTEIASNIETRPVNTNANFIIKVGRRERIMGRGTK